MPPRAAASRRASGLVAGGALAAVVVLVLAGPASGDPFVDDTTRVSVATDGTQGDATSSSPAVSADGRYIAFGSNANNLVADDTNGVWDIFLTDTTTGITTRISVADDGTEANARSFASAISADGRYITYDSRASNLVPGDTNGVNDVFLTDTSSNTTILISATAGGTPGDEDSGGPDVSADGRYVTYHSSATDLVPGDTNGVADIFLTDTSNGITTRISAATDGTPSNGDSYYPAISADNRFVTYYSVASTLVAGDTNGQYDIYLTDVTSGATTLISTATDGTLGDQLSYEPDISADGRYITYQSRASNLVPGDTNFRDDALLTDTSTGITTLVSAATDGTPGNDYTSQPRISDDGRYITYYSYSTNLVPGDTNGVPDSFLTDTTTGTTTRVSTAGDGTQGDDESLYPAISADGRNVAYSSAATNLVPGDTNARTDIFLARLGVTPTVTAHPADTTVAAGDTARFRAGFTDATTIHWQTAADPAGPWTDIPGATSSTLDLPTNDVGTRYVRATATNADGTIATNAATLLAVLPATGSDPTGLLAVAGLLMVAGILVTRRRLTY